MTAIATLAFGGIAAVAPLFVTGASINCREGSVNFKFTPEIGYSQQTIQVQGAGDIGPCTSPEFPEITGGLIHFVGSGENSLYICKELIVLGKGEMQISWTDGTKSVISSAHFEIEKSKFYVYGGALMEGRFMGGTLNAGGTSELDGVRPCLSRSIKELPGTLHLSID